MSMPVSRTEKNTSIVYPPVFKNNITFLLHTSCLLMTLSKQDKTEVYDCRPVTHYSLGLILIPKACLCSQISMQILLLFLLQFLPVRLQNIQILCVN